MEHFLLTVQEAFTLRGRGILVYPPVPFDQMLPERRHQPIRFRVELRRPDGTVDPVEAWFTIPTSMPPDLEGYDCLLRNVQKSDAPKGTEIWISE